MNILITGAAQGIGASIARALATKENVLILVDLQKEKLEEFSSELKANCKDIVQFAGNLADEQFILTLQSAIQEHKIDVLINNAGISHKLAPFEELSLSDLDLGFKINVKAPFMLIQSAIPVMKANGKGIILNVASRSNIYGYNGMGIYASTKAAITSFTGTIALEDPEINAITIIPGRTNTPMQKGLRGEEEANKAQKPEYVGEIVAKVVNGEIKTISGDDVIIDFGEYKVVTELDEIDLHKNMH